MFSCATSFSSSSLHGYWSKLEYTTKSELSVITSLTHKSELSIISCLPLTFTVYTPCRKPRHSTYTDIWILCIPNVKTKTYGQHQCNGILSFLTCHIQSSHAFKTALETCLCKYQMLFQILPSLDLSQQSKNAYPLSKTVHLPCQ